MIVIVVTIGMGANLQTWLNFQGHFIFSGDKIIDLKGIINKVFLRGVKKRVSRVKKRVSRV